MTASSMDGFPDIFFAVAPTENEGEQQGQNVDNLLTRFLDDLRLSGRVSEYRSAYWIFFAENYRIFESKDGELDEYEDDDDETLSEGGYSELSDNNGSPSDPAPPLSHLRDARSFRMSMLTGATGAQRDIAALIRKHTKTQRDPRTSRKQQQQQAQAAAAAAAVSPASRRRSSRHGSKSSTPRSLQPLDMNYSGRRDGGSTPLAERSIHEDGGSARISRRIGPGPQPITSSSASDEHVEPKADGPNLSNTSAVTLSTLRATITDEQKTIKAPLHEGHQYLQCAALDDADDDINPSEIGQKRRVCRVNMTRTDSDNALL
jgi:hypothetical protein